MFSERQVIRNEEETKEGNSISKKDIDSKILEEKFAGKSFKVYGINLPAIKQVLSTNLLVIQGQ